MPLICDKKSSQNIRHVEGNATRWRPPVYLAGLEAAQCCVMKLMDVGTVLKPTKCDNSVLCFSTMIHSVQKKIDFISGNSFGVLQVIRLNYV